MLPHSPPVPHALKTKRNWLMWRLVLKDGQKKPSKIPYYTNGRPRPGTQGTDEDRAQMATFDEAMRCLRASNGYYSGVGFAPFADSGVVALDFDSCVNEQGVIDPRVESLCEGTYTELSPSGRGLRAFFAGTLLSRKDDQAKHGPFAVEVYGHNGFVTVTGNLTETCTLMGWDEVLAPLSDAVLRMYAARGWSADDRPTAAPDDFLSVLSPTLGMSADDVRGVLSALPNDLDYETWVKVGMAVHHEMQGSGGGAGSDEGFALWHEWSKASPKYTTEKYCRDRWDSFGRYSSGNHVTMASVQKLAGETRTRAQYEAVEQWRTKLRECQDEYTLREKLCAQLRRDATVNDIDREGLAQLLQSLLRDMGTKLPIAECRALVSQHESSRVPTVTTARPLTEFGNAERMLDLYARELMYVPELASWYCWTGIYWRKATGVEIEFRAKQTIMQLPKEAEANGNSAEFYAFCAISQAARMVRNMVSLAASDPRVMVPAKELDRHAHLLGVRNGVVDLTTGFLLPASPEHRITKVCGCDYDPNATAPLFEQTVSDCFFGDAELIDFFQRGIGYSAMGTPSQDMLFIPFGNGSNGKSTVLGTVRRAFGNYAKAADATTFISDGKAGNAGGPREDLLRLKGARYVYVSEPDENGELREGAVKSMTGGDAITARGLYSTETVEITPTWVVWMPTNHKPIIKGNDNGIWRRLTLLPFTRNFDEDKSIQKDPKREEKLSRELTGVLTWIVKGAIRYQQAGLVPPRVVAAAREQYRAQMDLLAEWLEDCCELGNYQETSDRLWHSWEQFAKNRGMIRFITSSVALGRRLENRFPPIKGARGIRMRYGLRLKPDFPGFDTESVAGVAG